MKIASLLLLAPLLAYAHGNVRAVEQTPSDPECGNECFLQHYNASSCALTDIQCFCQDAHFVSLLTTCVQQTCTAPDALQASKYFAIQCHTPVRDRASAVSVTIWVTTFLALSAVALRVYIRLTNSKEGPNAWGSDDVLIVIAAVFHLAGAVTIQYQANLGLGVDIWGANTDDLDKMQTYIYVATIFYALSLDVTKLSILAFLLRIFPSRRFRIIAWTLIAEVVVVGIVLIAGWVFQCSPVSYAWTYLQAYDASAKCINIDAYKWATSAITVIFDLQILILPLPKLYKLSLSRRKKIQIMMMFSVGILITIASIGRMVTLQLYNTTSNPTWDDVPVVITSSMEVTMSIICACMPAMRAFYKRYLEKEGNSSSTADSYALGSGRIPPKPPSVTVAANADDTKFIHSKGSTIMIAHDADLFSRIEVDERGVPDTEDATRPASFCRK